MPKISYFSIKKRRGFKKIIKTFLFLAIFFSLATAGVFGYLAKDLPSPQRLSSLKLAESTKIYDRTGQVLLYDIHGEEKRTVVSLEQISPYAKFATIAAEDKDFYKHWGLDFRAIVRATGHNILVWSGLKEGRGVAIEGGSTITQQVIKNTLLSRERTIKRKLKEWILAVELEMKYPKEKILELYLNLVPYGSNAYGIEAAANTYFKKKASELSLAESALLASLPKAPTYFSPYGSHPEDLYRREHYILTRMKDLGFISPEEYETAKNEELKFAPNIIPVKAPHFVFYVKEYLEEKYGSGFLEKGGLEVITTLDWEKQTQAEKIIQEGATQNERHRAFNAALVSLDPKTGQILTMVGSKDYFGDPQPKNCKPGKNCLFDPNVNVTIRPRQPGSAFKPIVYAKVFEQGFSPNTMIFDLETNFDASGLAPYIPQNYDEKFRGPISLRQALAQSLNIPSVKVLYLAGVSESIGLAQKMGITTLEDPQRYGLALVLGGGEVKLLELTAAYGTFANDGVKNPSTPILKILNERDEVIEEYGTRPERTLNQNIARQISDILSDNPARAPMFGEESALYFEGRQVAVKTGTTQEYRDAWTVGYTPSVVVGVWAGNNDNTPIKKGPGAMIAAPLWRRFMEEALKDLLTEEFAKPDESPLPSKPMLDGQYEKVTKVRIDKISEKLATDLTPQNLILEKEYREIHSILHYVDKNNPLGPQPLRAESDPQYQNWEEAVKAWISSSGIRGPAYEEKPPDEYDNLHTEQNKPEIKIRSPEDGSLFARGEFITVRYDVFASLGLKKIEYFLDDVLLNEFFPGPDGSLQFSFSFRAPTLKEKNHLLTVVAYDNVENKSLDQAEIIID